MIAAPLDSAENRVDDSEVSTAPDFARRVKLSVIGSPSGALGIAEASKQIGFSVQRVYFITDVAEGARRGAHGHKRLRQCFVCLRGDVTLAVTKNDRRVEFRLSHFDQGVQVDAGCWRDLYDISEDALVLVMASEEYDGADYIRNYDDFRAWEAENARKVPYVDLRRYARLTGGGVDVAVQEVMNSGVFIGGEAVATFEAAFADYCRAGQAVGAGNGLDALSLALRAKGIGPGDEVIVPAHTFIATVLAVDAVGATPVLVDVEEDTGLIDPTLIAAAVSDATRAIVPVHLYGHPVDMDGVRGALGGRDVFVLEDAAQAHGAEYKGRRCGSLGDASGFSFYPTKNLGALGDAGAMTTSDPALAHAVRQLGNYGSAEKYHHAVAGVNSRLDPLNAAVLSSKLPLLDGWNARRRVLADRYLAALGGLNGLSLPAVRPWATPVWHVFPVRVAAGRRDALARHLQDRGVGVNIHYPVPIHRQECYAGRWSGDFPVAERLGAMLLSLPLDPTHSEAEIDQVINAVRDFFQAAP